MPPARPPLASDPGRASGQLLDILLARQDWDGARTLLERQFATNPAAARPRLIEVLTAQAATTTAEQAQLDIYKRLQSLDPENAEAAAGIDRIKKARAERARTGDAPEVIVARAPQPSKPALPAPPPDIEIRDPGADVALRKAREAEAKARATLEAQQAELAAERERTSVEVKFALAERERLKALLQEAESERERLSQELENTRASSVGLPPAKGPAFRLKRRTVRALIGVGIAAAAAGVAAVLLQTTKIEVGTASVTLLDRKETATVAATRVLRVGLRKPAGELAWTSADPKVATVDERGVITPVATGHTRVEARSDALSASVEVSVSLPARVVVEPAELTLTPESAEAKVTAKVLDASGAPWAKSAELAWSSSAADVATFADGKVQRKGLGEAVLTASLGDLGARVVVHSLDRKTALERGCQASGLDPCVELGRLFQKGNGVAPDEEKALGLFEKACEAGAMSGCVAAGEHYEGGGGGTPDVARALANYTKGCDGKATAGCAHLGRLYETTVHDNGKALASYRTACDASDFEGCWRLGTMYELGTGVARDTTLAADLHKRACDGGKAQACTSLAHMRWNGSGTVAKDPISALSLFEKACAARHAEACMFLGLGYRAGQGVVEDKKKAMSYFRKACEAGQKEACKIAPPAQ